MSRQLKGWMVTLKRNRRIERVPFLNHRKARRLVRSFHEVYGWSDPDYSAFIRPIESYGIKLEVGNGL